MSIFFAFPDAFISILVSSLSCVDDMARFKICGKIFGKKSATPKEDATRAILPLRAFLSICDATINFFLLPIVDARTPKHGGVFFGARPKTQPLQVMHTCQLVVEKGLDRKSAGCIAQGDIAKFYDRIRCSQIADWLFNAGANPALVGAVLRLHCVTQVHLYASEASFQIHGRTRGVLTGSRSSVTIGRIPVEDAVSKCSECWTDVGFKADNFHLIIATWVDNLFGFGPNAKAATQIIEDVEHRLNEDWGLHLSRDSKSYLVCKGHPDRGVEIDGWDEVQDFKGLGHIISADSSTTVCWQEARDAAWTSFWRNSGAILNKRDTNGSLSLLKKVTRPRLEFVWTRWPFIRTRAEALDFTQRKMTALCLRVPKDPNESSDRYFRRRADLVGRTCKQQGRWSQEWATALLNWSDHLERERNQRDWPSVLYHTQDMTWLQNLRAAFVSSFRTLWGGGTGTRLLAEAPKQRWDASLDAALQWAQRE